MSESQDKVQKKIAKAQVKLEKKREKARTADVSSASPTSSSGISPAERSANAAEKQVRLQRWRVILALLAVAVAAATFLYTVRPWEK